MQARDELLLLQLGGDGSGVRYQHYTLAGRPRADLARRSGELHTMNGGQRVVLGTWLAMIVLAVVRRASDPSQGGGLPPPNILIGSGILYTAFYGGAGFAPGLFGTLAVGTIVAAALKPYADARGVIPQSGPIYSLGKLLDQASGAVTPQQPQTTQGASA